jgi:outer membrane protein assembly factor BamB
MKGAGAWTTRAVAALAFVLAGAAGARAQLPTIRIDDVRVVEGSSGGWDQQVTVTLSGPSVSPVDVSWSTVTGSAVAGADFTAGSGLVHFNPGVTSQTLDVHIIGDTLVEWSPTLQLDEVFFVDLGTPTNATLLKSRATVTIMDDDRALPGLQLVSAVADGGPATGRVRLQWRVPPAPTSPGDVNDVLVRWNVGASCAPPADAVVGVTGGQFLLSSPPLPTLPATVKPPGETQVFEHLDRPLVKHCYSLFASYLPSTLTTERATVVATPLDTTSPLPLAWAYSPGGDTMTVVPPTVGTDAVYTVSSDGVVHAMQRGETGGAWPVPWNPVALGKPAHSRSPVVPLPQGVRLFVGTESGEVHAVDGKNGALVWSRSGPFSSQLANVGGVQGTPAGLFKAYSGLNDAILVGSNQGVSNNTFYMLDPVSGANLSTFSNGNLGAVLGMGVVDYPGNRVFVLTTASRGTLWGFDLGPSGSPILNPSVLAGGNPVGLAPANGSPVLRNGRVYFGTTNADVVVRRLSDAKQSILGTGDGEVKGFVFPDRRNGQLYFSTNTRVWAVWDTLDPTDPALSLLPPGWLVTDIPTPSIVLHRPGTDYLYVGGGDGRLYEIDVASASPQTTKKWVTLESGSQIGAPSLDGPNDLVLVGSATGVVYAVRVPLP